MKVRVYYARAGYGHVQVGKVIARALKALGPADIDIREADSLDSTPAFFAKTYPGFYLACVTHLPALWGAMYEVTDRSRVYACLRPLRSLANRFHARRLLEEVKAERPDAVVSTHFLTAELLASAKLKGEIKSRLITVVTDFYPHAFWVNEGTDLYWVMSEEGARDLVNRGVDPSRIAAGGIPVDPKFKRAGVRGEVLKKIGFEDGRFTLLLSSGSFGLGPQERLLAQLEEFADRIQVFVVCGNNRALKGALDAASFRFPVKVFGFVDFMPDLMEASDLIIAKSGGSTTVETLAKGVPMVVVKPIPGQESRNARLLMERNASFFIETPDQIRLIVRNILREPGLLADKKEAMRALARPDAAADLASEILRPEGSTKP